MSASLEEISFANAAGHRLAGILHHPERSKPSLGALACHGMLSSKESSKHRSLCERLAARGVLAFRFDFTGRGDSQGSLQDLKFSVQVQDVLAAALELERRGVQRLLLIGSSMGGTVSLLATRRPEWEIRACRPIRLVTLAAPAQLRVQIPEAPLEVAPGVFLPVSFFEDAQRQDPLGTAAEIRIPWLIVHGEKDSVVPVEAARQFHQRAAGSVLRLHPEAEHRFSDPDHLEWLLEQVVDFAVSND